MLAVLAGCADPSTESQNAPASSLIQAEDLARHVETLSSDSYGGRAPSTEGGRQTVAYLIEQFQAAGLEPGNGDSFTQRVPLVELTAERDMPLRISGAGEEMTFQYGRDFMGWTKRVQEAIDLETSPLVFVGYGIVAPEADWNDYSGLDMTGKTAVILVNDPGFATQDSTLFTGNAMTYYGRWTYKYEEAARQGAAGAIIIHETAPAGYPWAVVSGSWSGPQFDLVAEDGNMSRVEVEGWVSTPAAQQLFSASGLDYEALKTRAAQPGFEPVPMPLNASVSIRNTIRRSESDNVLGRIEGTTRPDEVIIYTAHWDHLGTDDLVEGDGIYNGAVDNATGTAALIELAEAFGNEATAPERSILFLAVTAEEQGLLGSAYYARHPVVPTRNTVAAINMDALGPYGRTKDVTVVGYGNSELDDYAVEAAAVQGRDIRPDPSPEKGFFYRSDHFSFAKVGIPALYLDSGVIPVEGPADAIEQRIEEYGANRYHKPADEYDPASWDFAGMVEDIELMYVVGKRLAGEDTFPEWRDGVSFKNTRDADGR